VPPGQWDAGIFVLPEVGDLTRAGVSEVSISASLFYGGKVHDGTVATWRPATKEWRVDGRPVTQIEFPLAGLKKEQRAVARLNTVTTIIKPGGDVLRWENSIPAVDGEVALITPSEQIDLIEIDPTELTFNQIDPSKPLRAVSVTLSSEGRSQTFTIRPINIEGRLSPPGYVYWFARRNGSPVTASVSFQLTGGRTFAWKRNGRNLQTEPFPRTIFLSDSDLSESVPQ
jgi:hypothetical protein